MNTSIVSIAKHSRRFRNIKPIITRLLTTSPDEQENQMKTKSTRNDEINQETEIHETNLSSENVFNKKYYFGKVEPPLLGLIEEDDYDDGEGTFAVEPTRKSESDIKISDEQSSRNFEMKSEKNINDEQAQSDIESKTENQIRRDLPQSNEAKSEFVDKRDEEHGCEKILTDGEAMSKKEQSKEEHLFDAKALSEKGIPESLSTGEDNNKSKEIEELRDYVSAVRHVQGDGGTTAVMPTLDSPYDEFYQFVDLDEPYESDEEEDTPYVEEP